jgi:hypothetical protein
MHSIVRNAWFGIALVVSSSGCKQGSKDAPAKAVESTQAEAPPEKLVDSLVPPSLAASLKFEPRVLGDQFKWSFSLPAPAGWPQNEGYASVRPPKEDTWGTKFYLGHTCAGACVDQDWAPVVDKEEFAKMAKEQVAKDEQTGTSRLMITNAGDITTVKLAKWSVGPSGYWTCTALLKAPYREAAPAFAKACESATAKKG